MLAGLLGWYPPCWIVNKHSVKQIKTVLLEAANNSSWVVAIPLGKGWFEVRKRSHSRPSVLVWSTKEAKSVVKGTSWGICCRTYRNILKISSISESPGKMGLRVHISAKIHPTDHMSTPVEYCRPPRRISGARYHSVTTYVLISYNLREFKSNWRSTSCV